MPAQAGVGDAQLRLTVVDQTASGIPTATVTLTPPAGQPITVMTDEHGVVTVPVIAVGTVKVHVEFVGFETYEGVLNIRRGANDSTEGTPSVSAGSSRPPAQPLRGRAALMRRANRRPATQRSHRNTAAPKRGQPTDPPAR